ncbi:hypothetical protein GOB57_25190 [Sinorhizobium meliloti]|nr:hypothetical protein [Sinorhizobium meliloti]
MDRHDTNLGYIEDRYGDGECGIFAQALHGMTGLAVVLYRIDGDQYGPVLPDSFPRHAAVRIGNDSYLDAFGTSTLAETSERFGVKLRVDLTPRMEAYPFGSAPGQGGYIPAEFVEAEAHALEMLLERGESCRVSDFDVARITAADERGRLQEMNEVETRHARSAGQLARRTTAP